MCGAVEQKANMEKSQKRRIFKNVKDDSRQVKNPHLKMIYAFLAGVFKKARIVRGYY